MTYPNLICENHVIIKLGYKLLLFEALTLEYMKITVYDKKSCSLIGSKSRNLSVRKKSATQHLVPQAVNIKAELVYENCLQKIEQPNSSRN